VTTSERHAASERLATIYVLCDSREPDPIARVRYVGRSLEPERRLKLHQRAVLHGEHTRKACWMKAMQNAGGTVLLEVVATVPMAECDAAEIAWIAKYRALGALLTNHTDGGGGVLNPTPDTRVRMGLSARGNKWRVGLKHGPEALAKMSACHKGRPMPPHVKAALSSPEARAKISAALTGRKRGPLTAEHRALLSAQRKGIQMSPEALAKMTARMRTPEARERTRRNGFANKGRKATAAQIARMVQAHTGRRHSAATKQKMSAWQQGENSPRAKLTWDQVREMRARHAAGESARQLTSDYPVSQWMIYLILRGENWVDA